MKPSKKVVPENSVSRTYALEAPRTREESTDKTETSVALDLRKSDEDGIFARSDCKQQYDGESWAEEPERKESKALVVLVYGV